MKTNFPALLLLAITAILFCACEKKTQEKKPSLNLSHILQHDETYGTGNGNINWQAGSVDSVERDTIFIVIDTTDWTYDQQQNKWQTNEIPLSKYGNHNFLNILRSGIPIGF